MTQREDDVALPNGEDVEAGTVILFEGYPYRVDRDDGIRLSPVYWGDSALDLTFEDAEDLGDAWGEESRGTLREAEWQSWLADARADERFGDAEVDAIAQEVLGSGAGGWVSQVVGRLRRLLGLE